MKRNFIFSIILGFVLLILQMGCNKDAAVKPDNKQPVNNIKYKIDTSTESYTKVEAEPEKGFNYGYYLYVPAGVKDSNIKYMLVEPNNSGTVSDDNAFHDKLAYDLIRKGICNDIANELKIPLLVPTFDRPQSNWHMYTHSLDRDTLIEREGKLARIDLQLIKMIEDAQQILKQNNINVENKVFMDGFSASGVFVNRFAALYPEKVKAVAGGGINGMPIIPLESINGEKLVFHIGIADIDEIAGIKFNMEEFKKVPEYLYMGYLDTNDTLDYEDAYSPEEVSLTEKVLGKEMKDRWAKSQEIYKELGIPAQMVTYNGTAHHIRPEMENDIISFFRANAGGSINFIKPFEYPFIEMKKLDKVHINSAYWYGDTNIPYWIKNLNENKFIFLIDEWIVGRDYQQLSEYMAGQPRKSMEVSLKNGDKIAAKGIITGNFSYGDGSCQGFWVEIPDSELSKVKRGVAYTLQFSNDCWINDKGVTVTRE